MKPKSLVADTYSQERINHLEKLNRWYLLALDIATSLVHIHGRASYTRDPLLLLDEAQKFLNRLLTRFRLSAFFLVREEDSDFYLARCQPESAASQASAFFEQLIENGDFTWALNQNRTVITRLRDDDGNPLFLHVLATKARVRGMYMGILNSSDEEIFDSFSNFLSIIFHNTAYTLESAELYFLLDNLNQNLEHRVQEGIFTIQEQNLTLARHVKQLQTSQMQVEVISRLLRIVLNPAPIQEQLAQALSSIIQVPWIEPLSQVAIFLLEADDNTLCLAVQHGLPAVIISQCRRILVGGCLCGQAALRKETLFAHGNDTLCALSVADQPSLQHYAVPILSRGEAVGVLTVYLPQDHQKSVSEEEFLSTVSDTLAELIERNKVDEALQSAKEAADAASRAKSAFLANMSHEIRTPMNAILGLNYLLGQTPLTDRQQGYLDKSRVAAESLLALLNDILDFSKVEAGKLELEREEFQLEKILSHISTLLETVSNASALEIVFDLHPNLPQFLLGDALRLQQVLLNLMNNAIKFTNEGEVVLVVEPVETENDHVIIRFTVQDTGIGMDANQLKTLFDAFSQGDNSTTRKYGGTGLGLAISHRLVNLMGGTFTVSSIPNEGSLFSFSARFGVAQPVAVRTSPLRNIRVLIVDDNATSREVLAKTMHSFGWRTTTLETGSAVLNLLESASANRDEAYQFILLDEEMPKLDGIETAQLLRKLPAPIPRLLLLTKAGAREAALQRAGKHLFDGVVEKPFTPMRILNELFVALAHVKTAAAAPPSPKRVLQGVRLLLVEDNIINQQVAQEILESAGAEVLLADNGPAAIQEVLMGSKELHGVLMDVQMPGMDGYETTRLLRRLEGGATLPIIAMTANVLPADRARCLSEGMNDYVAKPVNPQTLFATLARWIPLLRRVSPPEGGSFMGAESAGADTGTDDGILNAEVAIARLAGNRALFLKLLNKFVDSYQNADATLRTLINDGATEEAERYVHTLKGSAGNLGMNKVWAAADDVEQKLRLRVSLSTLNPKLLLFNHALQNVLAEAISFLNVRSDSVGS